MIVPMLNQFTLALGGTSSSGRIEARRSIFIINPAPAVTLDTDPVLKDRLGLGSGSDTGISIEVGPIGPIDPPFACFTDPGTPFKVDGVNRIFFLMLSRLPSLSFRTGVLALRTDTLPSTEPASPISAASRMLVSLSFLSIDGGVISLKNALVTLSSPDLVPEEDPGWTNRVRNMATVPSARTTAKRPAPPLDDNAPPLKPVLEEGAMWSMEMSASGPISTCVEFASEYRVSGEPSALDGAGFTRFLPGR
mmetsp:Transcript_33823/g.99677  ORF Transcript_33823/g.99677 Transcript_33823/m.99677 type:complete len:250 (-) Transcript_33823:492-1241(-)